MNVTVVYALADRQCQRRLELPAGATVSEAIRLSGLPREFPEILAESAKVGIYGVVTSREAILRDGDRVEIYRPLQAEAKEARRARLKPKKRT